ncbi:MAG: hypothetical protein ABIG89_01435 [Candidatus Woesearchaeota archaeon]
MDFLRKLGIWIVSLLLSICIFTFIFGTFTHIDLKEAIGDIYTYADSDVKQKFSDGINSYCFQLSDAEAQAKVQADAVGMTVKEAMEMQGMSSEEINTYMIFAERCDDFNNPNTPKKKIFTDLMEMMSGGIPNADDMFSGQDFNHADNHADNYSPDFPSSDAMNSNIWALILKLKELWSLLTYSLPLSILILFGLLFFFIHEPLQYLRYISKMLIRTGVWLIIPFIILLIWTSMNPIDTTPIMQQMVDGLNIGSADVSGGYGDVGDIPNSYSGMSDVNVGMIDENGYVSSRGDVSGEYGNAGGGRNSASDASDSYNSYNSYNKGPDIDMSSLFVMMFPIVLKQAYPFTIFLIGIFFVLFGVAGLLTVKLLKKKSNI